MASFNKVILLGNLTRDVEMRYTPAGMALAQFGLAMNRQWKDSRTGEKREEVTFVDIDVWGKQAENCHKYLAKGRQAHIEGHLKLDQWEDKQTGQKRSKLKVVADHVLFVGGQQGQDGGQQQGQRRPPAQQSRPQSQQSASDQGGDEPLDDLEIREEQVPF